MTFQYPVIDPKASGKQIRTLCAARGLSPKEIQQQLSLASSQAVYHWQSGRSLPNVDNLYALSKLLDVHMEDFLVSSLWLFHLPDGSFIRSPFSSRS